MTANLFADYAPRERDGEGGVEDGRGEDATLPDGLAIAPATDSDIDGIVRLLAWREGISLERAAQTTNETLRRPREKLFLVARLAGRVIGFGRAELVERHPAPYEHVPPGWYLVGLIIDPAHRRRGIGAALTRARLAWITQRADEAYYFANSVNRATIDLHARFEFREIARDFTFPRATFNMGGVGVLFRVDL